jgi:DNA-binding NarL/FixJ family response regulator
VFYLVVTAEDKHMLSTNNNNDYDYNEREKNVLDLYKNGKNTRDIANFAL